MLVIPGGGYQHVAIGHEGVQIAQWLNAQGIPAFVVDYRVAPYHYPVPIEDGQRAMRLIRAHAAEYGIDPHRLGVWGFSAGGHLASTLGTHCDGDAVPVKAGDAVDAESCRPDFMILSYPVISMELPEAHAGSRMNLLGPLVDSALEKRYSNQLAVTAETPGTLSPVSCGATSAASSTGRPPSASILPPRCSVSTSPPSPAPTPSSVSS